MKKVAGFSVTLLFTMFSFMVFQFFVRSETKFDVLIGGGLFFIFYSTPFILMGIIITYALDKIVPPKYLILSYALAGLLISQVISILFNVYNNMEAFFFILCTTTVGTFVFYVSSKGTNKVFNVFLGFGIPIILFLLLIIL